MTYGQAVTGLQILWEMLAKAKLKKYRSIFYVDTDEIMLRTLGLHSYEYLDKTGTLEIIRQDIGVLLVHRLGLGEKGRKDMCYVQYIGDNVVRLLIAQVTDNSMYTYGLYFDYEDATGVRNFYLLETGEGWKKQSQATAFAVFDRILHFCCMYMVDMNVDENVRLYDYALQQLIKHFGICGVCED